MTSSRALGGGDYISIAIIFGRRVLADTDRCLMPQLAGAGKAASLSSDVSRRLLQKATRADVWSLLSSARMGRKPWGSRVALCSQVSSNRE